MEQKISLRALIDISLQASVRANLLFFVFLAASTLITESNQNNLDEFEAAAMFVFLSIVFLAGFIGSIPPAFLGSGILMILLNIRFHTDRPMVSYGMLLGGFIGSALGYLWLLLLGSLSGYTEFAADPVSGLLNGIICGSLVGAWQGRQIFRWQNRL